MPELAKTVISNSSNLKAYYRFESGALTTDSSGNGHTLTAIGSPAEGTGKFGGGVDLASSAAYSIVDHANLKPTTAYTFGARIKSTANDVYFFSNSEINTGTNDYSGFQFAIASNGFRVAHYTSNGTTATTTVTTSKVVNDGAWHLVIASWDGTTVRLYVDGKYETGGAIAAPSFDTTSSPRVGCRVVNGSNATFFTGSLDDMFLFNGTALSADQIKELHEGHIYGELRPGQYGTTAGLWHLNGNSTDFSGNNNHGTDSNVTYGVAYGKIGQGANFAAGNITIGSTNMPTGAASRTYIARIYKTTTSTDVIYGNTSGTANQIFGIFIANTRIWAWGSTDVDTGVDITLNKWHTLAKTYDGTTKKIYLDGVLVWSAAKTVNTVYSANSHQLGSNGGTANKYTGYMDYAAIFSRELTANELRQIEAYQRGLLGRYA